VWRSTAPIGRGDNTASLLRPCPLLRGQLLLTLWAPALGGSLGRSVGRFGCVASVGAPAPMLESGGVAAA
jgi:hypothetical protein